MVYLHVISIWKFLRTGAGVDCVKAAFCTICPCCLELHRKAIAAGDAENESDTMTSDIEEMQYLIASSLSNASMNNTRANDVIVTVDVYPRVPENPAC